jgi:uncharacterized membrane protein
MVNNLIKNNYNLIIIIIFILGCCLRFYGFNTQGYWFDEWTTLWHTNPAFNWDNFYHFRREFAPGGTEYEATPKIYFYILRNFFIIFGYTAENGRIFTAMFSIFTLVLIYFLSDVFTKKKKTKLLIFFLTSFNLFLIWEAQETRVQTVVLFFSLLNIFLFIKLLKNAKIYLAIFFLFSLIFLLSLYPVTFTIVLAQLLFLINYYKQTKIIIKFLIVYFFSALLYLYLNYDYLLNILQFKGLVHAKLNWHFFIGFFFNVFFGSTILGGFFLILFFSVAFINRRIIFDNLYIQLLLITIIVSYLLLIIYSFRNGIMAPRYVIFLVPIIIIFISTGIEKIDFDYRNYLYAVIILLTTLTLIYKIDDRPIKKPPTQKIIEIINESNIKNVTTNINNTKLFANYLVTHKSFYKNKLNFIDLKKSINFPNKIWLICKNNMRADVGENPNITSPDCYSDVLDRNMKITKKIKELDLQLSLYER